MDGIVLMALVIVAPMVRLSPAGWDVAFGYVVDNIFYLLVVWASTLLMLYMCGLYDLTRLNNLLWVASNTLLAVSLSVLLNLSLFFLLFSFKLGRMALGLFGIFTFLTVVSFRLLYLTATERGLFARRALVLGTGQSLMQAIDLIKAGKHTGLRAVGILSLGDEEQKGAEIEGVPVVGKRNDLAKVMEAQGSSIETLILAANLDQERDLLRDLRPYRYRGFELLDMISLHEELAALIPLRFVDDSWLLRTALQAGHFHIRRVKGVMDFVISVIGLTLFLPFGLIVAILIKLDSHGPVFYRQKRVGRQYHEYYLYKFRTMFEDAESRTGPTWCQENDDRITRVGRWLRKFRIDEVPQLLNVLRGEMSLVGPRPERPVFVNQLRQGVPYYEERLLVRPGITGWAQVMYPYADDVEGSYRKLQYDLYYIKNMSFGLDFLILLRTVKIVLKGSEREVPTDPVRRSTANYPPITAPIIAPAAAELKEKDPEYAS
jgi:exopolysaccharide biosynthesis polyprenyl glycosylphosphotransferase